MNRVINNPDLVIEDMLQGILDAGATSCFLLLKTLGTSLQQRPR